MLKIICFLAGIGMMLVLGSAVFSEESTPNVDVDKITASAEKNEDKRQISEAEKEALDNLVVTNVQPNLNLKTKEEKTKEEKK